MSLADPAPDCPPGGHVSYSIPASSVELSVGKAYESVTLAPQISSVTVGPSYAAYSQPAVTYAKSLGVGYAAHSPASLHAEVVPSGKWTLEARQLDTTDFFHQRNLNVWLEWSFGGPIGDTICQLCHSSATCR